MAGNDAAGGGERGELGFRAREIPRRKEKARRDRVEGEKNWHEAGIEADR